MLEITDFILNHYDNLSLTVLILSIAIAGAICLYNYKSKLKEYIFNPRNTGYVSFLVLFGGILFFLIEKHYITGEWLLCNVVLWLIYLVSVVYSLKPKINYFTHPVLRRYAKKLYSGEILENLEFFEKDNHWFIRDMDLKIEYRLLQAKYFSSLHNYDKAYRVLSSIEDKYLYAEEKIFVNRKKAFQLTQMGAMSAALLLLGKPEKR